MKQSSGDVLKSEVKLAVSKSIRQAYAVITEQHAKRGEVGGEGVTSFSDPEAAAEQAVLALSRWVGTDMAETVMRGISEHIHADLLPLVKQEVAAGATNVLVVLSSPRIQEAITKYREQLGEQVLAAVCEIRDTQVRRQEDHVSLYGLCHACKPEVCRVHQTLSEMEMDEEDYGGTTPSQSQADWGGAGGGFVSLFSLDGGGLLGDGDNYVAMHVVMERLMTDDVDTRIQGLMDFDNAELSELHYSDRWPQVCEALAGFLPMSQHPHAETKAVDVLLQAFERLSPQQGGDVYLALVHHLVQTVKADDDEHVLSLESLQHLEEEAPVLWHKIKALHAMQKRLGELFLGVPDVVSCRLVAWTFLLLRTISSPRHGTSCLSPWHILARLDPRALWFHSWCMRLPPPQLLHLLQATGLLPDLVERARHGPAWGPPPSPPPEGSTLFSTRSSSPTRIVGGGGSSVAAAAMWEDCMINALAMLAHLSDFVPLVTTITIPPSSSTLPGFFSLAASDLPAVPEGVNLVAAPATNLLFYELQFPSGVATAMPEGGEDSLPPVLLLRVLTELFGATLADRATTSEVSTGRWHGRGQGDDDGKVMLEVATQGIMGVARRLASSPPEAAHDGLKAILGLCLGGVSQRMQHHATTGTLTHDAASCLAPLVKVSMELLGMALELPPIGAMVGQVQQEGEEEEDVCGYYYYTAAAGQIVRGVLSCLPHDASLATDHLNGLIMRLTARVPVLDPSALLEGNVLLQHDSLLTCGLLSHWLSTYRGLKQLDQCGGSAVARPVVAHLWQAAWGLGEGRQGAYLSSIVQQVAATTQGIDALAACGAFSAAKAFVNDLPCLYGSSLSEYLCSLDGETQDARHLAARLSLIMALARGHHHSSSSSVSRQREGEKKEGVDDDFMPYVIGRVLRWDGKSLGPVEEDGLLVGLRLLLSAASTLDGAAALLTASPSLIPALSTLTSSHSPPHQPITLAAACLLHLLQHIGGPSEFPSLPPIPPYHTEARLDTALVALGPPPPPPPDLPLDTTTTNAMPSTAALAQQVATCNSPLDLASSLAAALQAPPQPPPLQQQQGHEGGNYHHMAGMLEACWSGLLDKACREGGAAIAEEVVVMDGGSGGVSEAQKAACGLMATYAVKCGRCSPERQGAMVAALESLHVRYATLLAGRPAWALAPLMMLASKGGGGAVREGEEEEVRQVIAWCSSMTPDGWKSLCCFSPKTRGHGHEDDDKGDDCDDDDEGEEEEDEHVLSQATIQLLQRYSPETLAAMEVAGLAPGAVVAPWFRQCLLNVMDWREVVVYVVMALMGGRQYQVYMAAALLICSRERICHVAAGQQCSAPDWLYTLEALERTYTPPGGGGAVPRITRLLAIVRQLCKISAIAKEDDRVGR